MLLFASSPCPSTQTNETVLASSSTNARRRSQRSLFFTGPFGVRHFSSRRHRTCQPSLKHFSMYLLSVRTSIAPSTLSRASHTAVSSIRFCVVSVALPTSCSVLPSRSINAAHPPRPATPSALQLPSVHTRVFMGRSIHCLAPSRSSVIPDHWVPFRWPTTGAVAPHDGLVREERPRPLLLGRVTWGGKRGSVALAPGYPVGGSQRNHVMFRWRQGGKTYVVGMHAWEPFTEACATLRRVVLSLPGR